MRRSVEEDRKRTKDETLALYRKLLANANQLIRNLRGENREKDRIIAELTKGKQLAQEEVVVAGAGAQGRERNPLELAPEEVWELFFDRLDNWQDLKSCYDTCQLFRQILEGSKNQWLFPGVLPLLVDHFDEDTKLKCRQICKSWRDLVDKEAPVGGTYYLPYSGMDDPQRGKLEEIRALGIEDPFPLRHVTIYGCHQNANVAVEPEEVDRLAVAFARTRAFVDDAKEFFWNFGPNIKHLTLDLYNFILDEEDVWDVLLFGLTHCTNLKSLRVSGYTPLEYFALEPLDVEEINALMPAGFGVSSSLVSLEVDQLPGFRHFQDFLFGRCSSQLKRVQVEEWSQSPQWLATLPWDSLEELDLSSVTTDTYQPTVVSCLVQTTAPNLTKLAFRIESHREDALHQVLLVASKFPKLAYLQIENLSGFPLEAVNSVPEGLVASPSLKTLEFPMFNFFGNVYGLCFDVLLYFPNVEVLNLRTLKNDGEPSEETMAEHSLVELPAEWLTEERIYLSNVWKLMPCLRTIALKEVKHHFFKGQSKFQPVFTREKYNAFCTKNIKN